MYLERTNYYAKPGRLDEVLEIRRQASDARRGAGLPGGTILVKSAGLVKSDAADDGPDVQWECRFAGKAEQERDLAARAASPDFEAARARMRAVIDRFERHVMSLDAPGVVRDVALDGMAIAPRELTFTSGAHELTGYFYVPPGPGPFACMITNHGSTVNQGSSDVCRPSVAATLMSWNIASFLPHRRGYGNSTGPAWRAEVPAEIGSPVYDEQLVARLDRESDDVVAALEFVCGLPEIDAGHVGVMGSSFGGINTLLAAAKSERFRCALEFAGAAMNWERTPRLRALMHGAGERLTRPIFFIQCDNDFSVAPTRELGAALAGGPTVVEARVYPAFGLTKDEGHYFERNGTMIWGPDVRAFLEAWL